MVQIWQGSGAGNTFVLGVEPHLSRSIGSLSAFAIRACEDKYDGLLVVSAGEQDEQHLKLQIINRDGSSGGVCLNGLRVAAVWTKQEQGHFEMDGHLIPWRKLDGRVELLLRVEDLPGKIALSTIEANGLRGMSVPFWNPHVVFPVESLADVDLDLLARSVREQTEHFPDGVNVEVIADASDGSMHARVNERGVGETQACASGAVAIALTAWAGGVKGALDVRMPGGVIRVARAQNGGILVSGGAMVSPPRDWAE